jgi:hypothetical protein
LKKIALASTAYLAIVLATVFPSWIELITGCDPDGRDGSVELFIAGGLLTLAVLTFAVGAMRRRGGVQKRRAGIRTAAGTTG